jgi:predicted DNA-binding protein
MRGPNKTLTHKQVSIRLKNEEYEMLKEWSYMQRKPMAYIMHDLVMKLLAKVGKDIRVP